MGSAAGCAGRTEKRLPGESDFGQYRAGCLGVRPAPHPAGRTSGCPFPASTAAGGSHPTGDARLSQYCRHLTNNEIRLMTLQRIINRDPLSQGIPASFVSIYTAWPPERQKEMLEDCQGALCRALFNKNAADGFWYLFENTYQMIVEHPGDSVQSLFTKIQAIPNCIARCPDFDALSLKYFISVVKDGVQQ